MPLAGINSIIPDLNRLKPLVGINQFKPRWHKYNLNQFFPIRSVNMSDLRAGPESFTSTLTDRRVRDVIRRQGVTSSRDVSMTSEEPIGRSRADRCSEP